MGLLRTRSTGWQAYCGNLSPSYHTEAGESSKSLQWPENNYIIRPEEKNRQGFSDLHVVHYRQQANNSVRKCHFMIVQCKVMANTASLKLLEQELGKRGLSTKGNKSELMRRLEADKGEMTDMIETSKVLLMKHEGADGVWDNGKPSFRGTWQPSATETTVVFMGLSR
ncbi:hypothetical protein VTN77DRAFT_8298 [Rasamsonia byssochlamydoides]|uniref:uncharacterized protein n=1 Tax=Rasamsonia byssochlamydoides TaxID=89139 RepID=UPI00374355AA